jgi:hypothetical protein
MTRSGIRFTAALALTPFLAGCSSFEGFGNVCPAIAWFDTVDVELTGLGEKVTDLEVCVDGVCSVLGPGSSNWAPVELSESPTLDDFNAPTPTQSHTISRYSASQIDDDTWEISFEMGSPDHATVRALSATGAVLGERDAELEWTRVGGSGRCGRPTEAQPITLDIAS